MSELTLKKIKDELDLLKNTPNKFLLLFAEAKTTAGSSEMILGLVPYRTWRVVNVGFSVWTKGESTKAEQVSFGFSSSDASGDDPNCFGIISQDVNAGKEWASGDMFQRYNDSHHAIPDAPGNGGTHVWANGTPNHLLKWQNKQGLVTIYKVAVALGTATVFGWALIEIGEV